METATEILNEPLLEMAAGAAANGSPPVEGHPAGDLEPAGVSSTTTLPGKEARSDEGQPCRGLAGEWPGGCPHEQGRHMLEARASGGKTGSVQAGLLDDQHALHGPSRRLLDVFGESLRHVDSLLSAR